jgi:hypothetical protein
MPPCCKLAIILSNLRNYHRGDAQYQFFQSQWCFLLAAPVMARVWRQTDFLYNGLAKFMWILFTVPVYWIKEAVIHPPLRVSVRMAVIQLNFEVTFCKCYAYFCLLIAHNISQGLAIRDEDLCLRRSCVALSVVPGLLPFSFCTIRSFRNWSWIGIRLKS